MDEFSPVVITSKLAEDDFMKIKQGHADILTSMQDQANRVKEYETQKAQETLEKQMRNDAQAKEAAESDRKTKELEIKQAMLAQ